MLQAATAGTALDEQRAVADAVPEETVVVRQSRTRTASGRGFHRARLYTFPDALAWASRISHGRAVAAPVENRISVNDVSLCWFEWGREHAGAEPTIVLSHATGFHARCWDRVVARLGARHVVALDTRGHGRSDKVYPVRWRDFGRDLAAFVRRRDLHDVVAVGHSAGGHSTVEAAALEPGRFRRLVLIDPTILAPDLYASRGPHAASGASGHPAGKRRREFASVDEMLERLKERPSFAAFDPGVLRDYCAYGLLPRADGAGFALACPPAYEAAVYDASLENRDIYEHVHAIGVPVLIVRAMEPRTLSDLFDFRYSPTWPALAGEFRNARDLHLPDRTHFLPLEDPGFTASLILDAGCP
jgi:pimeloyl-ACP methyl ester carboxylesterase